MESAMLINILMLAETTYFFELIFRKVCIKSRILESEDQRYESNWGRGDIIKRNAPRKIQTKRQLLLEVEELQTRLDATERRLLPMPLLTVWRTRRSIIRSGRLSRWTMHGSNWSTAVQENVWMFPEARRIRGRSSINGSVKGQTGIRCSNGNNRLLTGGAFPQEGAFMNEIFLVGKSRRLYKKFFCFRRGRLSCVALYGSTGSP